jgi:hypothetical protein
MLSGLLAGCGGGLRGPATTQPSGQNGAFHPNGQGPRDAQPGPQLLIHLEVYRIRVPMGSVSRSDEFWKHVDEQVIDVAIQDLLIKNGLRAGLAAAREWAYFKRLLEQHPVQTKPESYQAGGAGFAELLLKEVRDQDVFFFNMRGGMEGRSFDASQNVMCLQFEAAQRKPGTVHVRLCPMIRTLRKRFVVVADDDHREIQYVSPEKFYDAGLRVDVPLETFMVVAPSSEAAWKLSLGHRFLVDDGPAGRTELVLLLAPRLFQVRTEKVDEAQ